MSGYPLFVAKAVVIIVLIGFATYWTKSAWCLWALLCIGGYRDHVVCAKCGHVMQDDE